MTQRLHDWGELWGIRQTDQAHDRPNIRELAQQQAQQLEPITIGHLAWVLKHLPDKACGPDAVSTQLLRNGTPAQSNESNTGTHGGILVLGDVSCGLTALESYSNQGCGFQAFLWQATDCTILVAGTYLKTGETLQSEVNATILARLLALVQAINHPFVLLGDWQNSPGSIASTVLPSKFHFEVLAPDVSLLSGNVIDYALIHTSLAGATSITTEWAIPWRRHALLSYHFNIEEATKEYRQIQQFPPLPATPDIDFRPWTTYKSTAYELDLYGNPPNETAQQWADWLSCTEQYLLQEHPCAPQGRGSSLRARHKPLTPSHTVTTWKRGRPAFWEQLKARFQLAQKQPTLQARGTTKGFMQATAGLELPHGVNFLTLVIIGGIITMSMQPSSFATPLNISSSWPTRLPMMKTISSTKPGFNKALQQPPQQRVGLGKAIQKLAT